MRIFKKLVQQLLVLAFLLLFFKMFCLTFDAEWTSREREALSYSSRVESTKALLEAGIR